MGEFPAFAGLVGFDAPPRSALVGFTADPFGVRLRTCSLARSSFTCNFFRSAAAAALVGKNLLARRRVWPFRTYHSNEPSAHVCRRTQKSPLLPPPILFWPTTLTSST